MHFERRYPSPEALEASFACQIQLLVALCARAAARALEKLIHDTERRDWPRICGRPATCEQVSAYLRTKDCTFPDADDSPRLNAHLAAAARAGNVSAIRRLAAEGAQVNAGVTGSSQWTALHYAVRHRRHNGVRALLDLGSAPIPEHDASLPPSPLLLLSLRPPPRPRKDEHEFCLRTDSHMAFVKDWDVLQLRQWADAQNEYAILST